MGKFLVITKSYNICSIGLFWVVVGLGIFFFPFNLFWLMVGKISVCYENIVRFLYICRRAQIKITSTPTHHFLVATDRKFYYRNIKNTSGATRCYE